jgi:hypothetical protein
MSDKSEMTAAAKVLFRITLAALFTTVEVLAALSLDGWLSIALWVIATWNVCVVLVLIIGLSILADAALKSGGTS